MSNTAGRQLTVSNLPWSVGWQDLKDLFREVGTVVRSDVAQNPSGRSRGYGTVLYATVDEAQAAITTFNNYEWNGRKIEVREDRGPAGGEYNRAPIAIGDAPIFNEGGSESEPVVVNVRALYVGNIPYSVAWQDVKDLFRQAGSVYRAEVPLDSQGRSKGYGTLLMGTLDEARKAVSMFNGYEWNGRRIDVREDRTFVEGQGPASRNNHRGPLNNGGQFSAGGNTNIAGRQLFVGNLPFTIQWQELKDLFREVGNVQRADIAVDNQGRSRGYGQVLMSTVEEAQLAIETLKGRDVGGRPIEVREDKFASDSAGSVPGTQVFVGNLPFSSRWQDLKDLFRPLGLNPIHADVISDPSTGRSKGCGVVRFQTPDEAERAVQEVNGMEFNGRNVMVRLDKFT
ncbi:hypothetical protein DFJ77DRAFT_353679 [Powellomyces hirtus]|nr:hypothetical protein DFJ77DRAFT_353679 [Powellomyces hirtus]